MLGWLDASLDRPLRHSQRTARCLSVKPTRHPCQVGFRRSLFPAEHSARDAAPETPLAEITLGQSFRRYVVMNNQVRQVEPACACGAQSLVHIFIFASKKSLSRATERSFIQPDFLKDRARKDGIAAHQYSRVIFIERNNFASAINPPNHAHIIHRQPDRRTRTPLRHIWAANEIHIRLAEGGLNASKPSLINLFIVVYHADQIAIG